MHARGLVRTQFRPSKEKSLAKNRPVVYSPPFANFVYLIMRILGIDPGSETTGWGVIEDDGRHYRLVECGTVSASKAQKFPARLLRIATELEQIIERHHPDACAIEDGFLATNVKVTLKLGQVRGVAMLVAERAALDILEYSPRLVKQTVVGHGNAEKFQVQQMVKTLLSLASVPEPHDASDALAVAICHFHHARSAQRLMTGKATALLANQSLAGQAIRPSARRRLVR
jgi:crossover junction endodeoxyribonuclease RuvC